jgi:hypothetical protein
MLTWSQWKNLHLSKFDRVTLGLKGDVPFAKHLLSIDD